MPDSPRLLAPGLVLCAACAAPAPPEPPGVTVIDGYDWSVPPGVGPRPGTGLYSEEASPARGVEAGLLDLTWRQLEPSPGVIRRDAVGHAEGFDFGPWNDQRRDGGRYWLRLWMTDTDDAPAWVGEQCGLTGALPLADPCVWERARASLVRILGGEGVLADPDFVLVHVPRGFTWAGRDVAAIERAARLADLPAAAHLGPDDHPVIDDDTSLREAAAALRDAGWRALAAGVAWRYVEGGDRDLVDHGDHWRWVRAELGRTAADAFDGWIVPGGPARFISATPTGFAIDPRWLTGDHDVEVAVAFVDGACTTWHLTYATARGPAAGASVRCTGARAVRTARLHLPDARFGGATDLAIAGDVEVLSLRVVRR